MANTSTSKPPSPEQRQALIVKSFTDAFADRMKANPDAWRGKFRKMALTPFAFYRGSACLFFADMAAENDKAFLDDKTRRVWIHGDLHAQNFGTYLNSEGLLVFDVNDFDEAYVAPYTWDLKRLAASLTLIGYEKALSDGEIRQATTTCMKSYARQVAGFAEKRETPEFALTIANTTGKLQEVIKGARLRTRIDLLNMVSEVVDYDRRFKSNKFQCCLDKRTRAKALKAFQGYMKTIPARKLQKEVAYNVKDVCETKGAGIGSAGYKMYSFLLEGPTQTLENDIVISMKEGQVPSASRVTGDNGAYGKFFKHNGHRTVLSQRALQAYSDPWLGHAVLDGVGQIVAEFSPYGADLEWGDVNKLDDILELVTFLGQAVAKIHCVSDVDSDARVVPFNTDDAIWAMLKGKEEAFAEHVADFGERYGEQVREDYTLFVDAFRNRKFPL